MHPFQTGFPLRNVDRLIPEADNLSTGAATEEARRPVGLVVGLPEVAEAMELHVVVDP